MIHSLLDRKPYNAAFALILLLFLSTGAQAQVTTLPANQELPDYTSIVYPNIKLISDGQHIYHASFEKPPYLPDPEGEHSFFYRFVVSRMEIWDRLYLEKISKFDEEGMDRRVTRALFITADQ